MPRKVFRFTAGPEEAGMRLDQFVPSRTEELSRTFLRRVVDLGGAHVGGRRVRRCSHPVQAGELVEVYLDGLPLEPYVLSETDIVYRDRYLLAVAKPAGVETQPTPARYKGTLYAALLELLQDPCRPRQKPELGMVQRLDRDTSGVMVFSIHPRAHRGLTQAFAGRGARKQYLALVLGHPSPAQGEIRSQLARRRRSNLVVSVPAGGKEAVTRYRVVERFPGATLLEVEILTGRSHQIRAHLAEAGHPLLGDERYGGPGCWLNEEVPRQMLHAWRLYLSHPVTAEPLELIAPLPADMAQLLERLRRQVRG